MPTTFKITGDHRQRTSLAGDLEGSPAKVLGKGAGKTSQLRLSSRARSVPKFVTPANNRALVLIRTSENKKPSRTWANIGTIQFGDGKSFEWPVVTLHKRGGHPESGVNPANF
jgi:hypothetical protein